MGLQPSPSVRPGRGTDAAKNPTPAADTVLDVLDDEHAQAILNTLADGPKPAQQIVDACDASRPTVYRRLDTLEDAGILDSQVSLHPDGHHRKQFAVAVDEVTLDLVDGSFVVAATTSD